MPSFRFDCAKKTCLDEDFILVWRQLLDASSSPEKIYQSPEFFAFLLQAKNDHDQVEIVSVSCVDNGEIVGIIPIRFNCVSARFGFGNRLVIAPKMKAVILLGSVPLFSLESDLLEDLTAYLFSRFPFCDVLSMPALPADSAMYSYMQKSQRIRDHYGIYVMHGWRESHVVPLPESFDQYLKQFSSKKRFNLNRQVRLLREHFGGDLRLDRIERPEQVSELTQAVECLASIELVSVLLSETAYVGLAQQGLLLSYKLMAGARPIAVILSTKSDSVLHVHNIIYDESLSRLSVGASILHLAIEDLTNNFEVSSIDLGYSNPTHSHQSSNLVEKRGHVLLFRKTFRNRVLCYFHEFYAGLLENAKEIESWLFTAKKS